MTMHKMFPEVGHENDGRVDLSYEDAQDWILLEGAQSMADHHPAELLGDDEAGPFFFLSSSEPRDEELHRVPAHGHDADSWRMTVQGTTNMGREAYSAGDFRFQDGGAPYAADNATWGPDGGYGIVMFADRRGFPVRPVQAEHVEETARQQEIIADILEVEVESPLAYPPAIATTFGGTERAHLNESFVSAETWDEVTAGVRMAAGVLGDPECGPVVLMIDATPGSTAIPALRLDTEVLHVVVEGTASSDREQAVGNLWFHRPGVDAPAITAGVAGLQSVAVVADRRAVGGMISADSAWSDAVISITSSLTAQLAVA